MTREGRRDRSRFWCKPLKQEDGKGTARCVDCGIVFSFDAATEQNLVWDGPYLECRCPACGRM